MIVFNKFSNFQLNHYIVSYQNYRDAISYKKWLFLGFLDSSTYGSCRVELSNNFWHMFPSVRGDQVQDFATVLLELFFGLESYSFLIRDHTSCFSNKQQIFGILNLILRKGFKKIKNKVENSTFGSGTPPPLLEVEKNKVIFSETKPFFEHFM